MGWLHYFLFVLCCVGLGVKDMGAWILCFIFSFVSTHSLVFRSIHISYCISLNVQNYGFPTLY